MRPIIFIKTGWMEFYRGDSRDVLHAQHSYVKEHRTGHESRNFLAQRGKCYGFAPLFRQGCAVDISLERLGSAPGADYLDGVDVVWIARRPKGGVFAVGWYRNARLNRSLDLTKPESQWHLASVIEHDANLIPIDERTFRIPVTKDEGPRSGSIYYGTPELVERARALIAGPSAPISRAAATRVPPDVERRLQIERAAILLVWGTFEARGFQLETFESENLGWDLEARKDGLTLKIEVKGSAQLVCSPELTPNEYSAFSQLNDNYRLCVVTNALNKKPQLLEFRYSVELGAWVEAASSITLSIKTLTGARLNWASSSR
jgi:hypothetical protein